jgi:hypothetical protein
VEQIARRSIEDVRRTGIGRARIGAAGAHDDRIARNGYGFTEVVSVAEGRFCAL